MRVPALVGDYTVGSEAHASGCKLCTRLAAFKFKWRRASSTVYMLGVKARFLFEILIGYDENWGGESGANA
jgi:hypothetical protein